MRGVNSIMNLQSCSEASFLAFLNSLDVRSMESCWTQATSFILMASMPRILQSFGQNC